MYSESEWCQFLSEATDMLWAATGRRWRGVTHTETVTWLPRNDDTNLDLSDLRWGGFGYSSPLFSTRIVPRSIRLPRPDVISVGSVLIDGNPFTAWQSIGSWLVRTDGQGWPQQPDRITVTYTFGQVPPAGAVPACVTLAVELARFVSPNPDQPGQLPRRLRSEARQGGTGSTATDYANILSGGLTGLYTVDAWIRSVNPKGVTQDATVWSPDQPKAIRKA